MPTPTEKQPVPHLRDRLAPQNGWSQPAQTGLNRRLGNHVLQQLLASGAIQARMHVSQPNDPDEREADRMAEQVTRPPRPRVRGEATCAACADAGSTCSGCAAKREPRIRRKEASPSPVAGGPVSDTLIRHLGPGRPLDAGTRAMMEPRFGHDFGAVRVHTGAAAAESARAIGARAYTLGQDIVFGTGRYAPATTAGQRLLAHELTHVAQQAAVGAHPVIQRDGEPGTSVYSEHMQVVSTNTGEPGIWRGRVRREERTESGTLFHTGHAPIRYDENTCSITVPMTVSFRHATLADVQNCPPHLDRPAPKRLPAAVSPATLRSIADRYIETLNRDLNGWYNVRFDGCEDNPCHGRDMPIEVQVSEATGSADPDYEVAVANMRGRSCVDDSGYASGGTGTVLLYALGLSSSTMAHEGGHMVLGHGDEYREEEAPSAGRPDDRVREDDYSRMASHHSYGRFALMHERHFAFVPAFLNHVRPGCNARLVEIRRRGSADIGLNVGIGYAGFPTAAGDINHGLYLQLGMDLGIPLTRLRELELVLGPRVRMLADFTDTRLAFMLGFRLGLEHTFTPSSGGFTAGAFGEGGLTWFQPEGSRSDFSFGTYAEGGLSLGYTVSGERVSFQAEAALGRAWAARGVIGSPGGGVLSEPENMEFFRLGLMMSARF